MGLTNEQIQQLETTGTIVAGEEEEFKSVPGELDIVYNRSNAVIMLNDLGMVIQPHQVVMLSKFFPKERITGSRGLQIALNQLNSLIPVSPEGIKKLDITPPISKLKKLEEEYKDEVSTVDTTGIKVPVDKLTGGENPYIESALETEAEIEKANEEMIQGGAQRQSAQKKLQQIRKKSKKSTKSKK